MPLPAYVSYSPSPDSKYVLPLRISRISLSACTALYTVRTPTKLNCRSSVYEASLKVEAKPTNMDVKQQLYENIN
jgi:hypothetical protein